jgi:hypothetical protein
MSAVTEWMTDIAKVVERLVGDHDRSASRTDEERGHTVGPRVDLGA